MMRAAVQDRLEVFQSFQELTLDGQCASQPYGVLIQEDLKRVRCG